MKITLMMCTHEYLIQLSLENVFDLVMIYYFMLTARFFDNEEMLFCEFVKNCTSINWRVISIRNRGGSLDHPLFFLIGLFDS